MNTGEYIKVHRNGAMCTITFVRAEAFNILTTRMLEELGNALRDIEGDKEIRVLVITGQRHFCAGADIKELLGKSPEEAQAFSRLGQRLCSRLEGMDKVVIAAVSGYALGGGCEIALACDLRIASDNAKLGQPEVTLGIIPGFGGTQRLTRLIGIGRAKEMILTGRTIKATEAEAIGLVNKVVAEEHLLPQTEEFARVIVQKGPVSIRNAKHLINETLDVTSRLDAEVSAFAECFASQDHTEGLRAFLEKRPPTFKGI